MTDKRITDRLMPITEEEESILRGKTSIDKAIYMESDRNIINSRKLLDSGKLITLRPHTRFVDFPEHTHDYVEVVYMVKGFTTHVINGREILLKEGELLFLGQQTRQSIKRAGKEDIAVNFIVLPEFFANSLNVMGEEDTPLRRFIVSCLCGGKNEVGYLHFKVADVLPVQNLVENLIWTLINETGRKRITNRLTMELLFIQLLGCTEYLSHTTREEEIIVDVLQYVEQNYRDGSLGELSDIFHMDACWLSREIKRKTGKNYIELVQEKRLSQAAFYLKNTNMKISDISAAVGYENISYFHRLFGSKYGTSPKKYRDCK